MTAELQERSDKYCWMIKRHKRQTPSTALSPEEMTSELEPEGRGWEIQEGEEKQLRPKEQHVRYLRGYWKPGMIGAR